METTTIFWLSLAGCGVLAFFGIVISISQARVNHLKRENQVLGRENSQHRLKIDSLWRDIKQLESDREETADQLAQAMKEIQQLSDKVQVRGEDGRFINKN
jgi:Tfp pilus assembly protein PilN